MVADKGGIYFDANWLEVSNEIQLFWSRVAPRPVWEILAAF